jgi:hypothetical protein
MRFGNIGFIFIENSALKAGHLASVTPIDNFL